MVLARAFLGESNVNTEQEERDLQKRLGLHVILFLDPAMTSVKDVWRQSILLPGLLRLSLQITEKITQFLRFELFDQILRH